MTIRLKYDGRVFIPEGAVALPVGYQLDARLPDDREFTPRGHVKGSPDACRELLETLAALPPLSDEDRAEWRRVMAEDRRPPSEDGRIEKDNRP